MNRTLLLLLQLLITYGTAGGRHNLKGKSFEYSYLEGLCSQVICFVNDSIYYSNAGCESSGYTYYGTYHVKADTLLLQKGIADAGIRIIRVDTGAATGKNVTELCFLDQYGNNLSRHFSATFTRGPHFSYSLSYDSAKKILYYPKISNEEISLPTLHLLGIPSDNIKADLSSPMRYTYYLHLPGYIRALDLLNKDIIREGEVKVLVIEPGQLVEYLTEAASTEVVPPDRRRLYKERLEISGR